MPPYCSASACTPGAAVAIVALSNTSLNTPLYDARAWSFWAIVMVDITL
jgi:hypothetical protein